MLYFTLSVVVLAAMLFFPVRRLIFIFSVRRLQRRLARDLTPEELQGQQSRASFLAVILATAFSFFFNANLLGIPRG